MVITRFEAALRITCPPLRQRGEDILTLFTRLSEQFAEEYGCDAPQISAQEAAQILQAPWPGNVRELANLVERMAILHPHGIVGVSDLPEKLVASAGSEDALREGVTSAGFAEFAGLNSPGETEVNPAQAAPQGLPLAGLDLKEYLARLERDLIEKALDDSSGVVTRAADRLSIGRTTLVEKMRKYKLSRLQDGALENEADDGSESAPDSPHRLQ